MSQSVEERVRKIIVERLNVDEEEVTPQASFIDDLGMAFEEAFKIQIPDEDAEKIGTVKQAIDYITKHV